VKSGFQVQPESVVQVAQGGNLLVVTEPRNNVDSVKITDGSRRITELVNTNGDTFSLSGIAPGIYTLDVIVNQPNSNNRAAYETILVILQPGQAPQNPTQIIQKVKVVTDVSITIEDGDDDDGRDRDRDPCKRWDRLGYGNICVPIPRGGQCEQGYVKLFGACFDGDAVLDHDTEEECQADPLCREYRERYPSDPDPGCDDGYVFHNGECKPICGEVDLPEGELCLDDGDEITCDGPAVPVGNECVIPEEPGCEPGQRHIPEDKDCDGEIDPEFLGGPEKPIPDEEVEEENDSEESDNESEQTDDDGSNGDGSNANNGDSSDDGDSSDGEVFATD
jgi:hypothetical protein